MKFFELFKFSLQSLWRRKLRTVLTVLGVTIGTASIVVMVSIGVGLNANMLKQIEQSGSLTLITVNSYGGGGMVMRDSISGGGDGSGVTLNDSSIETFDAMEHVTCASPVYSFDIMAKSGSYEGYLYVQAMRYEMLQALKLPIMEGEFLQPDAPFTIMAGRMVGFNFYNPNSNTYVDYWSDPSAEPPVDLYNTSVFAVYDMNAYWAWQSGEGEAPKKYMLETSAIVGENVEEGMWSQYDYNVYADLDAVETLFGRIFKKQPWPNQQVDSKGKPIVPMTYNMAYVLVDDIDHVVDVQKQITDLGYQAWSNMDYLKSMQEQMRSIQYALAGIGSISLLVAAIGITNTMLMSIFERTKEIGIYKVLGCSLPNIRSMFLSEAALIGFGGGIAGLILSYLLSFGINTVVGQTTSLIPVWLALIGISVAIGVALVAGISPASRAMKLSPLEAIRSL